MFLISMDNGHFGAHGLNVHPLVKLVPSIASDNAMVNLEMVGHALGTALRHSFASSNFAMVCDTGI